MNDMQKTMFVKTQKFVSGLYVFKGLDYLREEIENSFPDWSPTGFPKQLMLTPDYLIYIIKTFVSPSVSSDTQDIELIVSKLKKIKSLDPNILVDLEN